MYTNVDNICYLYVVGMLIIGLDALTSFVFPIPFIQLAWCLNFGT